MTTDDETKGADHEHAEPHSTDHARVQHVPAVPAGSTGTGSPGIETTSDRTQAQAPPALSTDDDHDEPQPQIEQIGQLRQLIAEQTELWVGPLPAPPVLREYESILPGAAERIMRVHESQTTQVAGREDRIVDAEILLNKRGQVWAGVLALVFAAAGIVFIARGNNIGGGIMLSMPVTMLVVSFLPARLRRRGDTLETGSAVDDPGGESPSQ